MTLPIQENYSIHSLNSLSLNGNVSAYAEVDSPDAILSIIDYADKKNLPLLPIGSGTNLVLGEQIDYCFLKILSTGISLIDEDTDTVTIKVDAGLNWHTLVLETLRSGWFGLENLALIPGTVGAAPIQNIGAYGVEVNQFIREVEGVVLRDCKIGKKGSLWQLTTVECEFAYRDSCFKHSLVDSLLITAVTLQLNKRFTPTLSYPALQRYFNQTVGEKPKNALDVAKAVIDIRRSKLPDPENLPNAGSFFKNPIVSAQEAQQIKAAYPDAIIYPQDNGSFKIAAGWMIEKCGYKGKRRGSLGMHNDQALVMVNHRQGRVTASEVITFAEEIQRDIAEQFSVALEIEPRVYC